MGYKVVGFQPFWWTLDAINDPGVVGEVYDIAFRIVQDGPDLTGAEATRVALPPVVLDGWDLDLESVSGFLTYARWDDGRILLVSLTLYDWPE